MATGLGTTENGSLALDLDVLLRTRLLVTASSGGGKTGTLFRLCEMFSGQVQIIILDPEGEFAPLRAKHPFVLVGPDGETPAQVKTAALLAHRLLEFHASAICDIYELPAMQRHDFVRNFLQALIDAPKHLWHPVIVIVDEAHVFAPEKGQGESVAAGAMADLASRGRKRGFCPVLATQRLAKLSKNVAAEMQNVLIGRTTQVDQARAADVLNLSGKAVRDEFSRTIGRMPTGEFFAYGMAFGCDVPTTLKVDRAATLPVTGDKRARTAPPTPEAIRQLLPKFADLPAEAETKARTEEDLRREIGELKRTVATLQREQKQTAPHLTPERERMLLAQIETLKATAKAYDRALSTIGAAAERISANAQQIATELTALRETSAAAAASDIAAPQAIASPSRPVAAPRPKPSAPADGEALSGPEQRIVDAIAWFHALGIDAPEQPAVAFMAGYTYGAGGYNNPRGRLNQRGLLIYLPGDKIALTDAGHSVANPPDVPGSNAALHEAVLGKLDGPMGRILTPLLKVYPKGIDNPTLAEAAGYTYGAGGYNNPRGRLKSLGLIDYRDGRVFARDSLFPEAR